MTTSSKTGRVQRWRTLSSKILFKDRWLTLRSDHCVTATGADIPGYHVIEFPDWINIVVVTRDLKLLLVREYRHGRGEIVAGLVSGTLEGSESAEAAAQRELAEETGYRSTRLIRILDCYPNPATQNNRVASFLALDAERTSTPTPDHTEEIEIFFDDFASVLTELRDGTLTMQAMHIAALWSAAAKIIAGGDEVAAAAPLRAALLDALAGG
jgi:8-oxo-dGTP pyrophosphatase MutT (NUDIX family)